MKFLKSLFLSSILFTSQAIAHKQQAKGNATRIEGLSFIIVNRNYSKQLDFQRKDSSHLPWQLTETVISFSTKGDTAFCRKIYQHQVFSKKFVRQCMKLISEDTNTVCLSKPFEMIKGEKKNYSVAKPVSDFSLHGGEVNTLELLFSDGSIHSFRFFDPKHAVVECINDRKNRKRFLSIEESILGLSCGSEK